MPIRDALLEKRLQNAKQLADAQIELANKITDQFEAQTSDEARATTFAAVLHALVMNMHAASTAK